MTSPQIDTRLREAADDTRRAASRLAHTRPDITELTGRTSRRTWVGVGAGVAVAFSLALVLAVSVLGQSPPTTSPQILGDPTSPATPDTDETAPPTTSDDEGTGQGQPDVDRWISATPGNDISLPGALESLAPATDEPVVVDWESALAEAEASTGEGSWSGEGLRYLQGAVASTGEVLVTSVRPQVGRYYLVADPDDGTVQLVEADLTAASSVVAAPAGGWLISGTNTDGQPVILAISTDGQVSSSVTMSPAPPNGRGLLQVVGSEVWLVNSFESEDLDRGPQATPVSNDGGATLTGEVTWQPTDEALPNNEPVNFFGEQGALATVAFDDGRVNITWTDDDFEGEQTFIPVGLDDDGITLGSITLGAPMTASFGNSDTSGAEDVTSRSGDIMIVATADQVLAGRLELAQGNSSAVSSISASPDGRLWSITFSSTSLTIREVLLPTN